jgi:RalA-binding protein 1
VAVPISSFLQQDPNNAKFFQSGSSQPEGMSPTERLTGLSDAQLALRMIDRGNGGANMGGVPTSSSLPSNMEPPISQGQGALPSASQAAVPQRSSSEQGFYPDVRGAIVDQRVAPPKIRTEKPSHRASYHPSLSTVDSSPTRQTFADAGGQGSDIETGPGGKKISGPSNATPIPPGQVWGNKQPLLITTTTESPISERERKVRSKFWPSFNRVPGGSGSDRERSNVGTLPQAMLNPARLAGESAAQATGRAVFAVPLEQALAIVQIANLPAIVFRCIEYLEAKKSDEEEGIYRLSGSNAVIKNLKDRFNTGACVISRRNGG